MTAIHTFPMACYNKFNRQQSPNICILHFKEFGDAESVDMNAGWVFI